MNALTTLPTRSEQWLDELRNEMSSLWDRPFAQFTLRPIGNLAKTMEWMPKVNVFEKKGELVVKADLPGVTKENLKVSIEDGALILTGERHTEKEVKDQDYYRCETTTGKFYRRLELPFEAKTDLIAAKFNDGVLEVKIPMPLDVKPAPKVIPIS